MSMSSPPDPGDAAVTTVDSDNAPLVPPVSPTSNMEELPLSDRPGPSHAPPHHPVDVDTDKGKVTEQDLQDVNEGSQQVVIIDTNLSVSDYRNIWKFVQLAIYILAFISSLVTFGGLIQTSEDVRGKCLLYADVEAEGEMTTVTDPELVSNVTATVAAPSDAFVIREWPMDSSCDFCVYTLVCASIYAFICCWFYLVCGTSHSAYQSGDRPQLLVIPTLIISSIISILTFIAAFVLTQGFDHLCNSAQFYSDISCPALLSHILRYEYSSDTSEVPPDGLVVYNQLVMSEVTAWLTTATWITAAFILIVRIIVAGDFPPIARRPQNRIGGYEKGNGTQQNDG